MESRIQLKREGAFTSIEFELAQPKNSFRKADVDSLSAALDDALAASARCVVLRGAGETFSAGWDVASINPRADNPVELIDRVVGPFLRKLRTLPVPTISAVTGPALGFGLGLALSCDICIVDEEARLGSPFRHIGMVPDSGTHWFFLNRLGYPMAAELIYTGRLLTGAEAAQARLVNRCTPAGRLHDEVRELAAAIGSGPTQALRLSKEILLADDRFDRVVVSEAQQLARAFATEDLKEGIGAFQERRKPVFTGR